MGIQLTELISSRSSENFIVVIADIMFENWLVADIEGIKLKYPDLIKDDALNSNYDGQHGVSVIKNNWKRGGGPFRKNIHGCLFFKKIRIKKATQYSPSFNYLMKQLKNKNIRLY